MLNSDKQRRKLIVVWGLI